MYSASRKEKFQKELISSKVKVEFTL